MNLPVSKRKFVLIYCVICFGLICLFIKSYVYSSTQPSPTPIIQKSALELVLKRNNVIKCDNQVLKSEKKQRGQFYVYANVIKAERDFECDKSITFAVPADYTFLENLEPLVLNWQGPVSVALYSPGYDFYTTINTILYLRKCGSPLIKEYVSFHLFFESGHVPAKIAELNLTYIETDCKTNLSAYFENYNETYKNKKELLFPINMARNIAKRNSATHFVFVSDIELFPTPHFIDTFLEMITGQNETFLENSKQVFVLPVFEIKYDQSIPTNKTELQAMYKKRKAILFHERLCAICHRIPEFNSWMIAEETEGLDIFTVGKRMGRQRYWEPFYVGTRDDPDFDERFTWEGHSNKMVQGYLMCLLDYNYMILDNAFLIHKPGIKKEKAQLKEHMSLVRLTTRLMRNVVTPEYTKFYGKRDGCRL